MQQAILLILICLILILLLMCFPSIRRLISTPQFKNKIEIIQSSFTIAAIIFGGIWTYTLFIQERVISPRLEIEKQDVFHLAINDHVNLLRVSIKLLNTGKTRLLLDNGDDEKYGNGHIKIEKVKPLYECTAKERCAFEQINNALKTKIQKGERFQWPLLYQRIIKTQLDIEPGETDHIDFEFFIPSEVEAIRIYTFFRNKDKSNRESKKEIGWSKSEIYDFKLSQKNGQ